MRAIAGTTAWALWQAWLWTLATAQRMHTCRGFSW